MAHLAVKDLTFTYPNCDKTAIQGVREGTPPLAGG